MRIALITGGVLVAALTLGGTAPAFADGAGTTEPAPPATSTPTPTPPAAAPAPAAAAVSEQRLRKALDALLPTLPGSYTLEARELDGAHRLVRIGATRHREPASVYKLFIAYGVLTRIDAGALRYDDRVRSGLTVRASLRAMIEPSDNYAAQDLLAKVGKPWLNRLLHRNGFTGTTFWYSGHRTKTTTTADVARVLTRLARGQLVSKASTARFERLLETQVWREAIPPGLPDGVRQASKPGTLWTGTGMVQTDSAIVWGPRSRYVLVVMGSNGATTRAITRISRVVYRELEGPVKRPFAYDRQQMRATGALVLTRSVSRHSPVLGRFPKGTRVEVIDSMRTRYLVRIAGKVGWVDNARLTLRHPIL
ncbi:serine hydrolase [Amnibacterium kyonggiense]|uniref:Beta-lactamase class A n=1 Tax=Amnibacterium kyonggiense TaxID=595671 RepID=A0A4R7FQG8_9MICO|nr:serine hydrolase [Amnibacterium kyonggiense]TDS80027.1 beta-lactamase class A [Amnibacterium kyonggiense]